ncbi:symporter small accessory protein [uncultured Methanobrevibacter sp.]
MMVFGIEDPWIWGVYVLMVLITLICVVYGLINWNNDD